MQPKTSKGIKWSGNRKLEELLDNPVNEEIYGLFLRVKDSPRHIAISAENLINEVLYICSKFYQDDRPDKKLGVYVIEVGADLGWHYAADIVMPLAYALINAQRTIPKKIKVLLKSIESLYHSNSYWDKCSHLTIKNKPTKAKNVSIEAQNLGAISDDIAALLKKQLAGVSYVNININPQFTGEIKQMHVAHSDVAVGVAESGSTVFHHKIEKNGQE